MDYGMTIVVAYGTMDYGMTIVVSIADKETCTSKAIVVFSL